MDALPQRGAVAGSFVVQRVTTWVDGVPVIKDVPMLTQAQIIDTVSAVASLPYRDPDDDLAIELGFAPSRFHGMTNLEAMVTRLIERAARTGDKDEVKDILDRLAGKSKQVSESIQTHMTYEERLRAIADRRAAEAKPIVEGEASPFVNLDL